MKFMVLMESSAAGWAEFQTLSPSEFAAHVEFMKRVGEDLADRGELCDAQGLAPPERTLVVRARPHGAPEVSDGPFAETKEFLAGYWLVDVESEARAIEIAAHISTAPGRGGTPMHFPITLRPLGELPGEEM
jgi:hypothetical protein